MFFDDKYHIFYEYLTELFFPEYLGSFSPVPNMVYIQYIPWNSAVLALETLFFDPKSTYFAQRI